MSNPYLLDDGSVIEWVDKETLSLVFLTVGVLLNRLQSCVGIVGQRDVLMLLAWTKAKKY